MPLVKPIVRAVRHDYLVRPIWGEVDAVPATAFEFSDGDPIQHSDGDFVESSE